MDIKHVFIAETWTRISKSQTLIFIIKEGVGNNAIAGNNARFSEKVLFILRFNLNLHSLLSNLHLT